MFIGAALSCATLVAQAPTAMSYQVMVVNPKNHHIMQNQEVNIRMELRKGSKSGSAAWSHDYTATTSQAGVCTLSLDFAGVNWNDGPYYLATIVNGEEAGVSPVNAVPYALQAMSLGGVVTKDYLVGTWKKDGSNSYFYIFREDGTARLEYYGYDGRLYEYYDYEYSIDVSGHLFLIERYDDGYTCPNMHVKIISENRMLMGTYDGYSYTRQ